MKDLSRLEAAGEPPLSPQEAAELQAALWALLEKRVRYATMGDHGSVRVERAEALYESLCETLRLHLTRNGLPLRTLLQNDPTEVLDVAMQTLEQTVAETHALYLRALQYEPPVPNVSYRDTLKELGLFFERYDYRTLAQDTPCDIDYQLCLPVPETLCGVSYIADYLRRFLTETETIARFDAPSVRRLLQRAYGDPVELLVNLYEPVVCNAVGAALCGLNVRTPDIPASACRELVKALATGAPAQVHKKLAQAADAALNELSIVDDAMRAYFHAVCAQLAPRLLAALPTGDLHRIFVPLYS